MLFFINFRNEANLFRRLRNNKLIYLAIKKISILKQIYKSIKKMLEKFANYQNKKNTINTLAEEER